MTTLTHTCHGCGHYKAMAELHEVRRWLLCATCRAQLDALNAEAHALTDYLAQEATVNDNTPHVYCHHADGTEHVVYPDADDSYLLDTECTWRPAADDIDNEPPDDWEQERSEAYRTARGLGAAMWLCAVGALVVGIGWLWGWVA